MRRAAAAALLLVLAGAAPAPAAVRETPVPILLYHHVASPPRDAPSPALYVPARLFARQMAALDRAGYAAVTLGQAWRHWEEGTDLPPKPVILSFDDGFGDQYANAARVLRARRWPGVLNLQSNRLGARRGLSRRQVRRMLRDGWELAAHSVTHADLTKLGPERLEEEVEGSRTVLRTAFPSQPVDFFCYPYGRSDPAVEAAVRAAGYLGATTTRRGAASPADGAFALDRMVITGNFGPERLVRAVGATSGRR
jgi:peptidoglycan/xylan/chitin deacetylase (PgdA/CDA1 family)